MPRIKIDLPPTFPFTTTIPVRITDINYGGHVGNDAVLSLIHEARMQFLRKYDYTEMNFAGVGLIMADVAIVFKSEVFYGDSLLISVATEEFTRVSFDVVYKLEKLSGEDVNSNPILVATAKTGMVCYDYKAKKIAAIPAEFTQRLASLS